MKQVTPCMGLQEDYDDIYKRNITKIQKFKKAFLKKIFSQPNLRYKQCLNNFFVKFHHNQTWFIQIQLLHI